MVKYIVNDYFHWRMVWLHLPIGHCFAHQTINLRANDFGNEIIVLITIRHSQKVKFAIAVLLATTELDDGLAK